MTLRAADFGRVAVLYGGASAEREVSLNSGAGVLAALRRQGVQAEGLDVTGAEALRRLSGGGFDRVFVALHGRGGEDGTMQGALEGLGLPYTGSGVLGSALGMDKYRTKLVWQGAGLPTPASRLVLHEDRLADAAGLGFPLIVKPAHEGSSIGIRRVNDGAQLAAAWRAARALDAAVLVEKWIQGREYTVAILGPRALPVIEVETSHELFDYAAKYQDNSTLYRCPCGLGETQEAAVRALALEAFAAIDGGGWGRVDLLLDAEARPWLIEVNTIPGMTDHSLLPMAAREAGLDYDQLVWAILAATLEDRWSA